MERLSTGIPSLDKLIEGGIPRGFMVAAVGEPGTGKTILCIHFINEGVKSGDKNIYVTTEETRESIISQAKQFGIDFGKAVEDGSLIIIDALMGEGEWTLKYLDIDELINKVVEAKKRLGYGKARLVIDSLSAFWLSKPAMARQYSYTLKKVLSKWDFTVLVTSQYAITTSEAFGFGVEHVADGIIRFRKSIKGNILKRYVVIEKMRQTNHSLYLHEIQIVPGIGMVVTSPAILRREDIALPEKVMRRLSKKDKSGD